MDKFFPSSSLFGVSSLILFPLFATSISNTSSTGGKSAAGVIDTCGNLATGVIDTVGEPWPTNTSAKCKKIWNDPLLFSGNWGKMIHENNLKQKYLVKLSFKQWSILITYNSKCDHSLGKTVPNKDNIAEWCKKWWHSVSLSIYLQIHIPLWYQSTRKNDA